MSKLNFKKPHSVEAVYYTHGLVCASYPRTVIAFVALAVILCRLVSAIETKNVCVMLVQYVYWL